MASRITKGFGCHLAVRHDVIRLVEVAFVDLREGHEAIDVNRMRAFDLDGLEFVLIDLHVTSLAQLIAAALLFCVHHLAGFLVHHLLAQAVPGLGVDLMKMRLLGLRGRRKQLDRACHQREPQVTFPVRARCHGKLLG
jgi:hypothetical protein